MQWIFRYMIYTMLSKTPYRLQGMEVELHAFLISVLCEGYVLIVSCTDELLYTQKVTSTNWSGGQDGLKGWHECWRGGGDYLATHPPHPKIKLLIL